MPPASRRIEDLPLLRGDGRYTGDYAKRDVLHAHWFENVYVYAADDLELLQFFLSRRRNHRQDEYGGVLANRTRLLREVIEDTKDAIGDTCAVAVRITIDEMSGPDGHLRLVRGA
jgi:2,4-dienoyl-CoA reductase-like NADH-dependent reductase (Old Yellow Enzyme family)